MSLRRNRCPYRSAVTCTISLRRNRCPYRSAVSVCRHLYHCPATGSIPRIGAKFQIHFGPSKRAWLGLKSQHRGRSALEDIQMATKKAVVHPIDPFLFDGPSFQNFVFHLKSSSNAPNHTLTITSQTSVNTNFAFIQGTWQGDGPNAKNITGSITDGTVSLTASWANGMGGINTLVGRLTPVSHVFSVSPSMGAERQCRGHEWAGQYRRWRTGRGLRRRIASTGPRSLMSKHASGAKAHNPPPAWTCGLAPRTSLPGQGLFRRRCEIAVQRLRNFR